MTSVCKGGGFFFFLKSMNKVALRNPYQSVGNPSRTASNDFCFSVEISGRYAYACTTLLAPVAWVNFGGAQSPISSARADVGIIYLYMNGKSWLVFVES